VEYRGSLQLHGRLRGSEIVGKFGIECSKRRVKKENKEKQQKDIDVSYKLVTYLLQYLASVLVIVYVIFDA